MGELEDEGTYEGQVRFTIVSAEETATAEAVAELERYELGSHGLVVLDSEGNVKAHIPGHEFGKQEIVVAIETVTD